LLTKRQYLTLAILGVFSILLFMAPRIFVPSITVSNGDNAAQDLEAYGKSIAGDTNFDAQAASLGNRVVVHRDGEKTYYTLSDENNCFRLDAGSTKSIKVAAAECN
jgi:hypothetical protein